MSLIRLYKTILCSYPILTKSVTDGCLMGSGDIFCQALSKRDRLLEEYSLKRTLVMMTYGLLINGPSLALAYTYIYPAMGQGVRGLAYKLSFNTTIHTFISMRWPLFSPRSHCWRAQPWRTPGRSAARSGGPRCRARGSSGPLSTSSPFRWCRWLTNHNSQVYWVLFLMCTFQIRHTAFKIN